MEELKNSNEKIVTFENTIKEGTQIMVDGIESKIEKVEGPLNPNNGRGGFYRITAQPIDGSLSRMLQVFGDKAQDWYILYQNGKK